MDDKDFPTIRTGNGFQNDLIATSNDRIKRQVVATKELQSSISSLQSTIEEFAKTSNTQSKRLIKLTAAIKEMNTEASKQTDKLVKLTKWIVALTVVLVVGLVIQLVITFK